jgi:hypothetical protein
LLLHHLRRLFVFKLFDEHGLVVVEVLVAIVLLLLLNVLILGRSLVL